MIKKNMINKNEIKEAGGMKDGKTKKIKKDTN